MRECKITTKPVVLLCAMSNYTVFLLKSVCDKNLNAFMNMCSQPSSSIGPELSHVLEKGILRKHTHI